MTPIHELLSRIRWDAALASRRFVIGYWDRVAGKVLHIDLREISWDADNPTFFDLMDEEGGHTAFRSIACWKCGKTVA